MVGGGAKALQIEWEVHSKESRNVPPVEEFLEFVMFRTEVHSNQSQPTKAADVKPERDHKQQQRHRAVVHLSTNGPTTTFKYECILCPPDKHPLYLCPKYNSMTVTQRQAHMKTHRLCFNCLAPGHRTADCRSTARCKTCSGRHHTMVHNDTAPAPPSAVATNTMSSSATPAVPNCF